MKTLNQTPAAPAQAQHSRFPNRRENFHPRLDVALDKMRHNIVPELSVCIIAEAYDALHANAQRLADALTNLTGRAVTGLHQDATHDGLVNCEAIARAREALAEWSKSI